MTIPIDKLWNRRVLGGDAHNPKTVVVIARVVVVAIGGPAIARIVVVRTASFPHACPISLFSDVVVPYEINFIISLEIPTVLAETSNAQKYFVVVGMYHRA